MTTTTVPQALTRLIDRVESAGLNHPDLDSHREHVTEVATGGAFEAHYGKADEWEVNLASFMFAMAIDAGLGKTGKVAKNFTALDKGLTLLARASIDASDGEYEVAKKVSEMTNNLAQLYILSCEMAVLLKVGDKAAEKLNDFMCSGDKKRMAPLMFGTGPLGFAN